MVIDGKMLNLVMPIFKHWLQFRLDSCCKTVWLHLMKSVNLV